MPTIEALEAHHGGNGSAVGDMVPVDEMDRFRSTRDGMGFLRFMMTKLTGQVLEPSPALSEHFDHASGRRDPFPHFEGRSYLG